VRDFYVSPTGSDSADGSRTAPFQTVRKAVAEQGNGDRILIEAGDYVEPSPLAVRGVIQGQCKALDRGEVKIIFETLEDEPGLITLEDCRQYVLDGLIIEPPSSVLLPNGTPDAFNFTSVVAITGGEGNLVTDTICEFWAINEVRSSLRVTGIFASDCDLVKIQRTDVRGLACTFSPGTSAVAGGSLYGIRVENTGTCSILDTRVTTVSGVNANVAGILTGIEVSAPTPDVARISNCVVREIFTHGQAGEGQDFAAGIGAFGLANGVNLVLKNSRVFVVRSGHDQGEAYRTQTAGYRIIGAQDARLQSILAYRADAGIRSSLLGLSATWLNITADRVGIGIWAEPATSDAIRIVLRNIALSRLVTGYKTTGNVSLDVDYINTYDLSGELFDVEGSFAEHVETGGSIYQFNPRFVAPDDAGRDFSLEFISQLVNTGTDI